MTYLLSGVFDCRSGDLPLRCWVFDRWPG